MTAATNKQVPSLSPQPVAVTTPTKPASGQCRVQVMTIAHFILYICVLGSLT